MGIAKRLDSFFMKDLLCEDLGRFKSWFLATAVLDHKVVVLELDFDNNFKGYPFKFNRIWFEDVFCKLLMDKWKDL